MSSDDVKENVAEEEGQLETSTVVSPSEGSLRPAQAPLMEVPASGCGTLAGGLPPAPPSYVYALGRVEPRFPSLGVEKEFAQATGRAGTAGLTDREALYAVLSKPENRYLSRQLCWVFTIEGLETYLLHPTCFGDFNLLVEAVRPGPRPTDVDVVIGKRGPLAPPEMCNGLMVPMVIFDQIYSFDVDSLIATIPRPEKGKKEERFEAAAEEVFWRIMQMADNAGATDEHRALNYLVVRYPVIYTKTAEQFAHDFSLSGVEVRPSPLSGARRVVDCIFSYTNRNTDYTEKFFCRVDVTEEWPFLVTKMSPYFER
jgi:PatG C-terminal